MGEVLHVEIARKTNSSLRRKDILNLVKKAVDNFENPVKDFCIHNHRHLFDHVECIKLCSYSATWKTCRSDEKYEESEKKAHSLLSRFPTPTVIKREYYMFKLFEAGENEENLEASFSNDGPRASHHWILPSKQFQQEWESLVFEPSVKTRLLDYMKMAIIYSQKHVNDSLIAWSKVVLIHGPPGTGKTTLCKAFAHKATIRLGGHFDYGQLIEINSNSLFSKYFSESGKLIEKMFSKIHDLLEDRRSIVFLHIDEVESLATSRKNSGGSLASDNIRAVNCLLTQLDKVKRYPNLVILTTSNIVDSIDVAFVDRADIKLCIGNPSADLIYEIYAGSINELIRCDIIQTTEDFLLPPTIQAVDANDSFYENAQKLWNISMSSVNLSGRTLKRIPFLTHCNYIKNFDGGCALEEYLDGMILAVEKEKSEVQIISEKGTSDKSKTGPEKFPQFMSLVKHKSPPPSCTSPCVTSSTKVQEKNRKFTASSLSSNLNSGAGSSSNLSSNSSSSSTSSSIYNYDSDAESRSRSNTNVNVNVNANANEKSIVTTKVNTTTTKSSKPTTSTPKPSGPPGPRSGRLRSMSRSMSRSPPGPKSSKKLQAPVKGRKRTATATASIPSASNKVEPEISKSEADGVNPSKTNHICKSTRTRSESSGKETKTTEDKIPTIKTSKPTPLTPSPKKRSRKTPPGDDPGKLAVPQKRQKNEFEKPECQPATTFHSKEIDERRMKRFTTKYRLHTLYIDLSKSTCTSDGVLIPFKPPQSSSSNMNKKPESEQPICVSLESFENEPLEVEVEPTITTVTNKEIIKENLKVPEPEPEPELELELDLDLDLNIESEFDDPPFDERPPTPTPCIPPNLDLGNTTPYDDTRNRLISQFLAPLSPNSKNMTMGPPMTPRNKPCKDDESFKLDEDLFKPKSPKSSDPEPALDSKDTTEKNTLALSPETKSNSNRNSTDSGPSSPLDLTLIEVKKHQQENKTMEKQQQQQEKEKEKKEKKEMQEKEQPQKPQVKESPQPKTVKRITLNGTLISTSTSLNKPSKTGSQNPGKIISSTSNPTPNLHVQSQQSKLVQNKGVTSNSTLILPKAKTTATTTPKIISSSSSAPPSTESILKSSTSGPKMVKKTRKTIQKVIRVRARPLRLVRKLKSKTNTSEVNPTPTPTPTNLNLSSKSQPSTSTVKTFLMPSLPKPSQNQNGTVIVKKITSKPIQSSSGSKSTTLTQLKVKPPNANTNTNTSANTSIKTGNVNVIPGSKNASEKFKTPLPVLPKHNNTTTTNNNNNSSSKNPPSTLLFSTFDKIKTAAERKMIVKPKSPQKLLPQSTSRKSTVSKPDANDEQIESTNGKTKTNTQPSNDRTPIPGCSHKSSSSHNKKADVEKASTTTTSSLMTRINLFDAKKLNFKVRVFDEPEENGREPKSLSTKSVEEEEKEGGNSVVKVRDGNKLICSHCNTEFPQSQNQNPNSLDNEPQRERVTAGENVQPTTCSNCGKGRDVFSCSLCGLLFNTEEEVEEHEATCLESIDTPPPHEDSDAGSGPDDLVLGLSVDMSMDLSLGGRSGWPPTSLFPIVDDHDHDHNHDSAYGTTELTEQHLPHPSMTSSSSPGSFGPGSNQMPSSVSSQTSDVPSISTEFSSPTMLSYHSSQCPTPQHQHQHNNNHNHSHNSSPENEHRHRYSLTSPAHTSAPPQGQRQMYPSPRGTTSQPLMSLNELTGALLDPSVPMNPAIRAAVQEHFSFPPPFPQPMPLPLCPIPAPVPPPPAPIPVSISVSGSNFHTCRFCHRCFISVLEMRQHVLTFHAGPVPAQLQIQLQAKENEGQKKQTVKTRALEAETPAPAPAQQSQSPVQEAVVLPNNNSTTVAINGHGEDEQSKGQDQSQSPDHDQDSIPTPIPNKMCLKNLDTPQVSGHPQEGSTSIEREGSNSLQQS